MGHGPIELPQVGAPIADTHAHLVMLDDPAGALERAAIAGVTFVVTVVDVTETPRLTFEMLQSWLDEAQERLDMWGVEGATVPDVRIIIGAHPHNAKNFDAQAAGLLSELLADERVVGVGEIGLDYHYDHSPRDDQRRVFRAQLSLAHEAGLPVVIHLRDAHADGLEILSEVGMPAAGAVLHCFTGDAALAEPFLELGCHVSFAGPVTFKHADPIRAAVASIPLDRMLVETDCPFMAPEPHRGKSNEPAWTVFTVERIAQVRGVTAAEVAQATYDNARAVLGGRR